MGREYHCQQVIVLQPFETRTPLLQLAQLFVGNALFQASMMPTLSGDVPQFLRPQQKTQEYLTSQGYLGLHLQHHCLGLYQTTA